jgi:hypothetical protein
MRAAGALDKPGRRGGEGQRRILIFRSIGDTGVMWGGVNDQKIWILVNTWLTVEKNLGGTGIPVRSIATRWTSLDRSDRLSFIGL